MEKEKIKNTENKLYKYYYAKRDIEGYKLKAKNIKRQIKDIENDIKNTNVTIDCSPRALVISDKIQIVNNESEMEMELVKAITELEIEKAFKIKQLLKVKSKIREKEEFISYMDFILGLLSDDKRRFINMKYGEHNEILDIASCFNIAQATAYRWKNDIIKDVAEVMIKV